MSKREREPTLREVLKASEKHRFEEEMTRPRVEMWPDEWVDWVESHRRGNRSLCLESEASPFCPRGIH